MFSTFETDYLDLSPLDTRNLISTQQMFFHSIIGSINLQGFNTSQVQNMAEMFRGAYIKTGKLNLSSFDTSKVETMQMMFKGCNISELDISSFDIRSIRDTAEMFKNTTFEHINLPESQAHLFKNLLYQSNTK